MFLVILHGLIEACLFLRPVVTVFGSHGIVDDEAGLVADRAVVGTSGGGDGHGQLQADVHAQQGGFRWQPVFHVDHVQSVPAGETDRHVGLAGKLIHVRLGQLAYLEVGNIGIAQRQHPGTQLVFFQLGVVAEVTELGEGVGHP